MDDAKPRHKSVFGRPTKYNREFHPYDLVRRSIEGESLEEVCLSWSIHVDTLYAWSHKHKEFSEAHKRAVTNIKAYWLKMGRYAAMGINPKSGKFNIQALVWMMKVGGKIQEPMQIEEEKKPEPTEVKSEVVYETEWGSTVETTPGKKDNEE